MFMLFSLVFDIYKKFCLFLAYSEDNISPETFEKKKKILTFILITVQVSLGIIQIALMVCCLRAAYSENNDLDYWVSL